jgi:hypothetical protein
MINRKQWGSLLIAILCSIGTFYVGMQYGSWQAGLVVLIFGIMTTIIPIISGFLGFTKLDQSESWFNSAEQLGTQKQRVIDHYRRIEGTLKYWKNKAAAHHRLHIARIIWSLVAGVSLPVLVQLYDKTRWAYIFMISFTTWNGLLVLLAYTLKSEEKFQGFRQQESDYYDISRNLLDFAKNDDHNLEKIVDDYFRAVAAIRKVGRIVETGSPPSAI